MIHIRDCLPEIKSKINSMMLGVQMEIDSLGESGKLKLNINLIQISNFSIHLHKILHLHLHLHEQWMPKGPLRWEQPCLD